MTVLRGLRLSVAEDYLSWLLYLYYPPATNAAPILILIWEGLKYEVSSLWRNERQNKLFVVTTLWVLSVKSLIPVRYFSKILKLHSKWKLKCKIQTKVLNFDSLFGFHSIPNATLSPLKSFWGSNAAGFLSVLEQVRAFCLKASEQPRKAVIKKKLKWKCCDS